MKIKFDRMSEKIMQTVEIKIEATATKKVLKNLKNEKNEL